MTAHFRRLMVLGLVVLVGGGALGCRDKKKPWIDAKAEHSPTLATIAAYAPLLKNNKSPTGKRIALLAADRITLAVQASYNAQTAKRATLDEQKKQPRLAMQSMFSSVHLSCHRIATITKPDEAISRCDEGMQALELELRILGRTVAKEAPNLDFPEKLTGWETPEANKKVEPLAKLSREAGTTSDKLAELWNDDNATFEALDGACKERLDAAKQEKKDEPDEDQEIAKIKQDAAVETIRRCSVLLQYSLVDKVLGGCLDRNDTQCFHPRSCNMVEPLRKSLDPSAARFALAPPPGASPDEEALPKALRPRAKRFVDQCAGQFRAFP